MTDPALEPLVHAFAVLFEREFGHVIKAGESGQAWKMVACNFVANLDPQYDSGNHAWIIGGDYIYDKILIDLVKDL